MSEDGLVDTEAGLAAALDALSDCDLVAVDTEFHWERTYAPRLALLQMAGRTRGGAVRGWAIDTLALDPRPAVAFLAQDRRLKVLHAGRIDLQIFASLREGTPIQPVFDTQRAAALVGQGYQIGYAALVESLTGRRLGKAHQYSDWTRRPLSPAQLEYALGDVTHLLDAYEALRALLRQSGRERWVEAEMAHLTDPETYRDPAPDECYRKVKAHRGLDRRALGVLRELAAWREEEARRLDLRPSFVLKDQVLIDLARRPPERPGVLHEVRGLNPGWIRQHGEAVVRAVRRGLSRDDLPPARKRRPRSALESSGAVELLKAWVTLKARAAGVASEVVATTSELEALARDQAQGEALDEHGVLQGWRHELVGQDLLKILAGEVTVGVDPDTGELKLLERGVDGSSGD